MRFVQGMTFRNLSSGLANGTLIEKFDISGSSEVYGGVLPSEFGNWVNLTLFRCADSATEQKLGSDCG